jgi:hypothetical protein
VQNSAGPSPYLWSQRCLLGHVKRVLELERAEGARKTRRLHHRSSTTNPTHTNALPREHRSLLLVKTSQKSNWIDPLDPFLLSSVPLWLLGRLLQRLLKKWIYARPSSAVLLPGGGARKNLNLVKIRFFNCRVSEVGAGAGVVGGVWLLGALVGLILL